MEDISKRSILKAALSAAILSQLAAAQSANGTEAAPPSAQSKGKKPRQKIIYKATAKKLDETDLMAEVKQLRNKHAAKLMRAESKLDKDRVDREIEQLTAQLRGPKGELSIPALRSAFTFQPTGQQFSATRFDLLAAQANALVQRCMQTRREWEQLYQTTADFYYDLETFEKLDATHRLEDAAGYYDLDQQQSGSDLAVADVLMQSNALSADVLEHIQNAISQNFNEYWAWAQLVGWLTHISGYQKGRADNTVIWNEVEKAVITYSHEAATAQSELGLRSAAHQLASDHAIKAGQAEAIGKKRPSLAARLAWDRKNVRLRKLRTEVLRDLYKRKQQLASEASGPLNYRNRLAQLSNSYASDLSAALERLPHIALGFRELAGYDAPLPASCVSLIGTPNIAPNEHVLDEAETWLRAAGNWYIKFLESEQLATFVLSVRHTVAAPDWKAFLDGSDLTIQLAEGMLPGQRHVRLRGVSLYTEESGHGWFAAKITCPREGLHIHADGSRHVLRQSEIPACRVGRIEHTVSPRPPERAGTNAAYNASPIGTWTVSLSETGIPAGRRSSISDLLIEIIYTYQEAK